MAAIPTPIDNRTIAIFPPAELGPVTFERMTGGEALGTPFEYDVDLLSATGDIQTASVLGKPFSVALSQGKPPPRWWSGIVVRLAQVAWTGSAYRYRARLRPTLWLLSRTSNCRIFQNTTIPDLVIDRLNAHGVTIKRHLGFDRYPRREYVVQYNETDLDFVSRLMEQEGIFYYFVHEKGRHTMWLVDAMTVPDAVAGYAEIPFATTGDRAVDGTTHPGAHENHERHEKIDSWSETMEVRAGAYAAKEYDFEDPRNELRSVHAAPHPPATADLELFEYPGHYIHTADRDDYVRRRLEEQQLDQQQIQGAGNARGLASGFLFTLTDHPASSQNRAYRVTAAWYDLTASAHTTGAGDPGPDYRCRFTGIDGRRPYRPPLVTPRPRVEGPQTAIVVGPRGEEIWTDKYGRVKVQFHWDRRGARDENSSCLVRVSQLWAGSGWGAMHIPRIGQEVVVDFLDGDPDRPIITGRVYNAANMPPYALAEHATRSTIRSHSTKGGGPHNFNELCFEDKLGAEQVSLQAEKDLEILVKHDEHREVRHDRRKDVGNDELVTVGAHRSEHVGKDESVTIGGARIHRVAQDDSVTIGGGRSQAVGKDEIITIAGARARIVARDDSLAVAGKQAVGVARDQAVDVGGARTLNVGKDDSVSVGGRQEVSIGKDQIIDVGKRLHITAGDEITLKTGVASITMKKNGDITIKGKSITVDGAGDITVKSDGSATIKGTKVVHN